MLMLIALNLLCLVLAAAGWLALRRGRGEGAEGRGFAEVLASARRVAERLAEEEEEPRQRPAGPPGTPAPLPIATRMAAIRLMLQGHSAAEGAAALGVQEAAVRALYRQHGREGEAL